MASLCIWMHPFAIKGLGSQYTNIATLLRGDTKGYSDNVIFDDNEQMTAYNMYRNPFKDGNLTGEYRMSANPREHQGRRRQVKFLALQGVIRTLPSVTVSNCC